MQTGGLVLVRARVENRRDHHGVTLSTDGAARDLAIAPKQTGFGSSANGGELLALAVATCYCNDVYREAKAEGIEIRGVEVEAVAEFGGVGEPARMIRYWARIFTDAGEERARRLAEHTDRVAEIHNTLRLGISVQLERVEISSSRSARLP
ncbi:MAG TPA: OsmC family protein [Gemmatimonadaceae bacterium]|nr:OsmC family protein [Gemmatimonadaceae bacterium]